MIQSLLAHDADITHTDRRGHNVLHLACQAGNTDSVDLLIQNGAATLINARDNHPAMTPFMYACGSGSLPLVQRLAAFSHVVHGVAVTARIDDVYLHNQDGSCLLQAVNSGSVDLVDWLLGLGLDINDLRTGQSPMGAACHRRDLPMVKLLISRGASVNLSSSGFTPLGAACQAHADSELLLTLLDVGADPSIVTEYGTALHYVASVQAATLLLERGCPVNARASLTGRTALHHAIFHSAALVDALLDAGADINAKADSGNTALARAVCWDADDRLDALRALLKRGADPTLLNARDSAPMHLAVICNSPECIGVMCAAGCDVDIRNEKGTTAPMLACKSGNVECAKLLLSYGARVRAADKQRKTPLHYVLSNLRRSQSMLEALLDAGADLNSVTCEPALITAASVTVDNSVIIKYLIERGARVNQRRKHCKTALCSAIFRGHPSNIPALIDAGADFEAVMGTRRASPLIHAIKRQNLSAVELLLRAGASPNTRDAGYQPRFALKPETIPTAVADCLGNLELRREKQSKAEWRRFELNPWRPVGTALVYAMSIRSVLSGPISTALIAAGADPEARDRDGLTILMKACSASSVGKPPSAAQVRAYRPVITALLEPRQVPCAVRPLADLTAKDNEGWTALHHASRRCNSSTLRQLLMWSHVEGVDINAVTFANSAIKGGCTPLMLAAGTSSKMVLPSDSLEACRILLEHGATLHTADWLGKTALHMAAREDNVEVMRLLVSAWVSAHANFRAAGNPLFDAKSLAALRVLLDAGVRVNDRSDCKNGNPAKFVLCHSARHDTGSAVRTTSDV